jgi:hypothetical protein
MYPADHFEIPLPSGPDEQWDGSARAWKVVKRIVHIEPASVIAEADRRVDLVMDPRSQAEAMSEAMAFMLTFGPDQSKWPDEARADLSAAMDAQSETKKIRKAQADLIAMSTIPEDYFEDNYWPAIPTD